VIQGRSGEDLVCRLEDGEDLLASLLALDISAGVILNGVGMVRNLELGYWDGTQYLTERVAEPVELLSLQGNLALFGNERVIHCHAAVARRGGEALGGHLLRATVHNTTEAFVRLLPGIALERREEKSGLRGLYPRSRGV
jgi:predicted DNA-binding protein with PD1-like motif